MSDIDHTWGQPLTLTATGDLPLVSGALEGAQTVSRTLLTNAGDDPYDPTFGAGARALIGGVMDAASVKAVIIANLVQLSPIDHSKPITVVMDAQPALGELYALVSYTDSGSGDLVTTPLDMS